MSKRVVIGEIGSGNYGMRVATAGNDAINGSSLQTSDKLSFDTLYPQAGVFIDRIYDVTVGANTSKTVNYGKTYDPFPFIYGTYKNGNTYISDCFSTQTLSSDNSTNYTTALAGTTLGAGFYWETTGTTLKVFNQTSSSKTFRIFILTLGAEGDPPVTLPGAPSFQFPKTDNIQTTSFRIRFNAGGGTADGTRVDVATTSDFSSGFVVSDAAATDPYSVTGLTSGVTYYFRLRSIDTDANPDLYSGYIEYFQKTAGVESDAGVPANTYSSSNLNGNGQTTCTINWDASGNTYDGNTHTGTGLGDDWFLPNTANVGSGYWIRFTENSATLPTDTFANGGPLNTWLQLNTPRGIGVSVNTDSQTQVTGSRNITAQISSSSSGSPVIASTTFTVQASASEQFFCPTCCVHESMLIATEEDMKSIYDIKIGDKVISHNFETGQDELVEVTDLILVDRDVEYQVNDLIMTEDHPVYLEGGRKASVNPEATKLNYKQDVDQLVVGDKMMKLDGSLEEVKTIESIKGTHKNYAVKTKYNNFYANGHLVDSVLPSRN